MGNSRDDRITTKHWLTQLEEFSKWYFSRDLEYCKQCKALHKTPPCSTCKWGIENAPPLTKLGEEIFEIFQLISTQLRTSFSGVIGLDYNVLFSLFDILGISNDDKFLYLKGINVIEREMLNKIEKDNKKREREIYDNNNSSNSRHNLVPRSIGGKR